MASTKASLQTAQKGTPGEPIAQLICGRYQPVRVVMRALEQADHPIAVVIRGRNRGAGGNPRLPLDRGAIRLLGGVGFLGVREAGIRMVYSSPRLARTWPISWESIAGWPVLVSAATAMVETIAVLSTPSEPPGVRSFTSRIGESALWHEGLKEGVHLALASDAGRYRDVIIPIGVVATVEICIACM